jgi:hypothetical protein
MNATHRFLLAALVTTAVGWLLAADSPRQPVRTVEEARERGQAIAKEAFGVLSGNLGRAITENGINNALHFCSVHATGLAGGVAQTNQVTLKRVSERARNLENRAKAEELVLLESFRTALKTSALVAPEVRTNAAGRFVFYAPIMLNNPVCLKCHGDPERDIAADTMALIRKLYPEDRATGFKFGELRGMWRIEFLESGK